MTSDAAAGEGRSAQERWEEEGRRISPALDRVAGVVVVGRDADAAASVALGIARVQAGRRRVAIGDLVGEVGPLQSLVPGDDPHGIVDSFLYGVSLNRIARPVDRSGNLFVLPSGSEPIVAEEIFRSERWGKLAAGFRDVGALLLLVVPAGVPGVETLAARVEGVVLAGRDTPVPPGAEVIIVAELPVPELPAASVTTEELPIAAPIAAPAVAAPAVAQADVPDDVAPIEASDAEVPVDTTTEESAARSRPATRWVRRIAEAPPTRVNLQVVPAHKVPADASVVEEEWSPPRPRRWPYALAAGIVAVAAAAALLTRGDESRSDAGRRATPTPAVASTDSVPAAGTGESAAVTASATDSGGAATAAGEVASASSTPAATTSTAPAPSRLVVSNPADSAYAAVYSVQIVAANTMDGARAKLRDVALGLPAAVISPMSLGADSTRWYRLTVGAFADRKAAYEYLGTLRATRKIDVEPENVVRLPYALLLDRRVPRSMAKATAANYASRGLPAYALSQSDGSARVYAGAFETPEQAGLLADLLRTAGIEPVVAYRTGRGF